MKLEFFSKGIEFLSHFSGAIPASIISGALGLLGFWKLIRIGYNKYIKPMDMNVVDYLSNWSLEKGKVIGKFFFWKIPDRPLLIDIIRDISENIDEISSSFIKGIKIGAGLEDIDFDHIPN